MSKLSRRELLQHVVAGLISSGLMRSSINHVDGLPLSSRDICVATDGDDSGPGTISRPWRTIQHAADQATPGKTIYVRAGVYDEDVSIRKSGTPMAYISFENFPGEQPVIDPKFKRQFGFRLLASYVRIKGFEIRNCKGDLKEPHDAAAIAVTSMGADHRADYCIVEENVVHHIIGFSSEPGDMQKGRAAVGILVDEADSVIVQHNTVYDIVGHPESMGIKCDDVSNMVIRRNLIFLCDKEGIRLITQDTDTENVIEGNIAIHNHIGIAINNARTSRTTMVRNNFSGWNWGRGINPKHTKNAVLTHNTIYANQEWGIDIHGNGTRKGDNYRPIVKNNLFCLNRCAWWLYDAEIFDEQVDYNFYQNRPGAILAAFGWRKAERCFSLAEIREKTRRKASVNGAYDLHSREGNSRFVDAAKGDFRLRSESLARHAADDGHDIGAISSELVEVGVQKKFSLAQVPDLGELRLSVEGASSDKAAGRAINIVDENRTTYWEIDTVADARREIVLALPDYQLHQLTFLTLTKFSDTDLESYRDFELQFDDGSGTWKPVPSPGEHPFHGYEGLANGETWALPAGINARKLKLHFLNCYSALIRIPGIRVYGKRVKAD